MLHRNINRAQYALIGRGRGPICGFVMAAILNTPRRRIPARFAAVAVAISAGLASPAAHAGAGVGACADTPPAKLEQVAPGVHVRVGATDIAAPSNGNAIANLGVVVGDEAIAVIDTGGSICDGAAFREAIRAISDKPIRYVVNTHVHPDHVLGNAAFAGDKPVIIGHRRLPAALAARGAHYIEANRRLVGADRFGATTIVPPAETVEDERLIDLGGRPLRLIAHKPGHTDNDLSVLDETTETLFTGDVVFMEHIPVIDGSIAGWLDVLAGLKALDGVRRIAPGHGPASAPWPDAAEKQTRYLERLQEDVRALIAEGGEIGAAKEAARAESEEWELDELFHERNANAAFSELEWEE
jgi:quinoprotein relay system zinc metallohydrolase 2